MENKKVRMADIAALTNLSVQAVSLVLSGKGNISAAKRAEVLQAAKSLGYVANLQARSLVTQKSYLMGVVLPYSNVSFFNNILSGAEIFCNENKYSIIISNNQDRDPTGDELILNKLREFNVMGLIYFPFDNSNIELLAAIKTVTIMRRIADTISSIVVDNKLGGFLSAEHLLEKNNRTIIFLGDPDFSIENNDRYQGFLSAHEKYQKKFAIQNIVKTEHHSFEQGYIAIKQALLNGKTFDAIFASSDYLALGAIKACLEAGLSVPNDVAILGYDDTDLASHQAHVPLSSVAQPKEEIGYLAARVLESAVQENKVEHIVLKPVLKIRKSSDIARS